MHQSGGFCAEVGIQVFRAETRLGSSDCRFQEAKITQLGTATGFGDESRVNKKNLFGAEVNSRPVMAAIAMASWSMP